MIYIKDFIKHVVHVILHVSHSVIISHGTTAL